MVTKIIGMVALLLTGVAVGATPLPAAIQARGVLVVGIDANYPPMEMKDPKTGALVGFDVDLGHALGNKLGIKIQWQETAFAQFVPSLQTGRVDMILSGFGDLPARQDAVTFVDYVRSGVQFFTQYTRAAELDTLASLCGKNVGVSRTTSYPAEVARWSEQYCPARGLPPVRITPTEPASARPQLRQGRIDASAQGNETLAYLMAQEPDTYALVGEPIRHTLMGIAMPKDQTELHQAVAQAMRELLADGTYQRLLEKYQMTPNAISEITINGGT